MVPPCLSTVCSQFFLSCFELLLLYCVSCAVIFAAVCLERAKIATINYSISAPVFLHKNKYCYCLHEKAKFKNLNIRKRH